MTLIAGLYKHSQLCLLLTARVPSLNLSLTTLMESSNEIISTVILSFPLILEGQLSVSGKSMCTKYWLIA